MRISGVKKIVKKVMSENENARNSDDVLYYLVCKEIVPPIWNMPFSVVQQKRSSMGLPAYESVSRCRRKLQKQYKELQATEKVENGRMLNEIEMKNFATNAIK